MSAGQVITGPVTSRPVIICRHVAVLPQASVAIHVLVIVKLPGQLPFTLTSDELRLTDPQLSVAVAIPVLSVSVRAWQSMVLFAGQVIVGATLSLIVMICEQVAVLPHTSDALYVLVTVYLFTQLKFDVTSLTKVTVAVPEQLSVVVTDPGFG
jgi:hypothetical protein